MVDNSLTNWKQIVKQTKIDERFLLALDESPLKVEHFYKYNDMAPLSSTSTMTLI